MSRFFAFGCSLTYYMWPTWADLIATDYKEYYNQGFYGRGNQYIMHSVYETDSIKQFTADDTVMVMLTSFTRNDCYVSGEWTHRGSIFNPVNSDIYTEHWQNNFWSLEMGIMTTWLAAKSIRTLLESRGCKFEIMLGLPTHINGLEFCNQAFTKEDNIYVKELHDCLTVKESMQEFTETNYRNKDHYFFKEENFTDVHPTAEMHGAYCRKHLSKYWSTAKDQLARKMHNMINLEGHRPNWINPKYKELRGIKIGTAPLKAEDPRFQRR